MANNEASANALKTSKTGGHVYAIEARTGDGKAIQTIIRLSMETGSLAENFERELNDIYFSAWERIMDLF